MAAGKGNVYRGDVTGEIAAAGYTAGGLAAPVTVTGTGAGRVDISLGAVTWRWLATSCLRRSLRALWWWSVSADELVAYIDFGWLEITRADNFALTVGVCCGCELMAACKLCLLMKEIIKKLGKRK